MCVCVCVCVERREGEELHRLAVGDGMGRSVGVSTELLSPWSCSEAKLKVSDLTKSLAGRSVVSAFVRSRVHKETLNNSMTL